MHVAGTEMRPDDQEWMGSNRGCTTEGGSGPDRLRRHLAGGRLNGAAADEACLRAMMLVASGEIRDGISGYPKTGFAAQLLTWAQRVFNYVVANGSRSRSVRRMKLVEKLELGGKRQLLLVACDGHRYLVGAGGDSVQSIVEMTVTGPSDSMIHVEQEMTCGS